jgi:hypothetical protein
MSCCKPTAPTPPPPSVKDKVQIVVDRINHDIIERISNNSLPLAFHAFLDRHVAFLLMSPIHNTGAFLHYLQDVITESLTSIKQQTVPVYCSDEQQINYLINMTFEMTADNGLPKTPQELLFCRRNTLQRLYHEGHAVGRSHEVNLEKYFEIAEDIVKALLHYTETIVTPLFLPFVATCLIPIATDACVRQN